MNQAITIVAPMTEIEARVLIEEIKADISMIGEKLLELYERDGWRALGYANWRECVMSEFDFQQSHVYRLLDFARIERNLSPIGENYPLPTHESQGRPLAKLDDPETQRAVWKRAVDTAPNGKVTAGHVKQVVSEFRSETTRPSEVARFHCKYWRCQSKHPNSFSVPEDTMTCTRCGAKHEAGFYGTQLTPGEHGRLETDHHIIASQNVSPPLGVEAEPSAFTCPRCGKRTVKVNGGAICLNSETCGSRWTTRADYEAEVAAMAEDKNQPALKVDFSDITTEQIKRDLAALEDAGYGQGGAAQEMQAELNRRGVPEDDTIRLRANLKTEITTLVDGLPPAQLQNFAAWLADVKSWLAAESN